MLTWPVALVQETHHQFHDPIAASKLRVHPDIEAQIISLHMIGASPWKIAQHISSMQRNGILISQPCSGTNGTAGNFAHFTNSRFKVTAQQVKAVIQRHKRSLGVMEPDANALDTLIQHYTQQGYCLYYQQYKPPATQDSDAQPLIYIISTPFQQRMLDQFGRRLVFLDATGGTNKYGYMFHTLLVQDDFGRGVPVAFMVSASETTEVTKLFLEKAAEAVRLPCTAAVLVMCSHLGFPCCATFDP